MKLSVHLRLTRSGYNEQGRLATVAEQGYVYARYGYNFRGERVKKTMNGKVVLFHFDLKGRLIAETDAAGQTLREYIYLNDRPLALVVDSNGGNLCGITGLYYYHLDHLNTPKKLTDANQQIVWDADYRPFGEAVETVTAVDNPLRFPGQYRDKESGLYYNYFRDYDPGTGRYVESDPIGLRGGVNTYGYVSANPLSKIDPYGLDAQEVFEDLWDAGPWDTYQGYRDSRKAMSDAQRSGLPNPHNGRQDAYRHCLWSCSMASNTNQQDAKEIGDNHEEAGNRNGQPANESSMDRFNNNVGRQCANQASKNSKSCSSMCLNKLINGDLQTFP